jgi:hypothetical protein
VEPPRRGERANTSRPRLPRFLEIEEIVMVHWPKSFYGNGLLFLVALGVVGIVGSIAAVVPGSLLGASAAAVALTWVGLYVWRRRVEAARERAWAGRFSFGDVIARIRAREALAPSPVRLGD